jgi:hypothetical protein
VNVKKLGLIAGSVLLVLCEGVMAEPSVKQWEKRFGGSDGDHLTSLQATSDGGYILGGYSWSDANGDKTEPSWGGGDYWIVKVGVPLPPIPDIKANGSDTAITITTNDLLVVDVSLEPFLAAGSLLYQGPWVAERLVEFGDFLATQPDSIHPVVREILRGGQRYTAVDTFAALQRLAELKASAARLWQSMDVLVVPTIGTTFTVSEVLAAPIDCNTMLGHYTHFGNLLDLLGVAIPLGATPDGRPYSAMLLGAAQTDDTVLQFAANLLDEPREPSFPESVNLAAVEEHI